MTVISLQSDEQKPVFRYFIYWHNNCLKGANNYLQKL